LDYTTLDDAALMRLLAYNRSEALEELYNRYARLVFSVALNSIGDYVLAEEITQDVFTRAWEKASTFDIEIAKVSNSTVSAGQTCKMFPRMELPVQKKIQS
jgi:RNA polymerase sigma-70 factor (ECF subfamily)